MPEDEKKTGWLGGVAKTYGDAAKTIVKGELGALNKVMGKEEKPMQLDTSVEKVDEEGKKTKLGPPKGYTYSY